MQERITVKKFLFSLIITFLFFLPSIMAISGTSSDGSIFVTSTTVSAGLVAGTSSDGTPGRTSVGAAGLSVIGYSGEGDISGRFGPDMSVEDTATYPPATTTTPTTTEEETTGNIPSSGSGSSGEGENSGEEQTEETTEEVEEQTAEEQQTENTEEDETNENTGTEEQSDRQESTSTIQLLSKAYTKKAKKTFENALSGVKENKETVIGITVGTALIGSAFYYHYKKRKQVK